jgi:hypothetical protein
MPFGFMATNDMWMFSKRFEWNFEFQVYFEVCINSVLPLYKFKICCVSQTKNMKQ